MLKRGLLYDILNKRFGEEGVCVKKILIAVGVLLVAFIIVWGICETTGSDYYNYTGFVTDVSENEKGETVVETLSGLKESHFTVKWYTKKGLFKKHHISVGDQIMLSTTHNSDTNLKKMKVEPGYSTEGKLVYTEGLSSPFILATSEDTKVKYLVSIVTFDDSLSGTKTGDAVKLYHAAPVYTSSISLVAEGVVIDENPGAALSAEDIAFIETLGYKIKQ